MAFGLAILDIGGQRHIGGSPAASRFAPCVGWFPRNIPFKSLQGRIVAESFADQMAQSETEKAGRAKPKAEHDWPTKRSAPKAPKGQMNQPPPRHDPLPHSF